MFQIQSKGKILLLWNWWVSTKIHGTSCNDVTQIWIPRTSFLPMIPNFRKVCNCSPNEVKMCMIFPELKQSPFYYLVCNCFPQTSSSHSCEFPRHTQNYKLTHSQNLNVHDSWLPIQHNKLFSGPFLYTKSFSNQLCSGELELVNFYNLMLCRLEDWERGNVAKLAFILCMKNLGIMQCLGQTLSSRFALCNFVSFTLLFEKSWVNNFV